MLTIAKKLSPCVKSFYAVTLLICTASISMANDDTNQNKKTSTPIEQTISTEGYYLGAHGGKSYPSKFMEIINPGFSAGGEFGYRDANYRTEITLDYSDNKFKNVPSGLYSTINLMLNAYYDFNFRGIVVPFLGAGIGYLNSWSNNCPSTTSSCNVLATGGNLSYQGLAGIGFNIKKSARLNFRYRYLTFNGNNNLAQDIAEIDLIFFLP